MLAPMSRTTGNDNSPASPLTYASAGVDVSAGDLFVKRIQSHIRRTHGPRVIHNPWGFAGLFRLDYDQHLFRRNYREPVLIACADGVGTKVKISAQLSQYDTIGTDLVAMNVNDLVVQGGEPLIFLDYIACAKLLPERLETVVAGIADACRKCGAALLGGETAEMPDVYDENELDLAGFAVGVVELKRVTDPGRVEPGDIIIGLESDGVHSNGFTLVRRIIEEANLDLTTRYDDLHPGESLGEVLLTPTRLYARPLVRVMRRYTVKRVISGMAHITGGGLAGNIERALHDRVDAVISRSAWAPPPIFKFLSHHGNISQSEMDRVFNQGIGFSVIVRPTFAASIQRQLTRLGERPVVIGCIEKGTGEVRINP